MCKQEICYVKQSLKATKDWDVFQGILRKVFKVIRDNTKTEKSITVVFTALCFGLVFGLADHVNAMGRTLKDGPAIVIAAFGTTTKAEVTYDFFEKQLHDELGQRNKRLPEIRWAFTSEIVRERANKKLVERGSKKRLRSLAQVLANLQDDGFQKVIVQPLHIFPGQEYDELKKVVAAFTSIGLDIQLGGTLLNEWEFAFETIDHLENSFLLPENGCNVLVAHGTPETFSGASSTYLGLNRYIADKYSNVYIGGVSGVLTRDQALKKAKNCNPKRVRLIPFMYVAGDHIMKDIMGERSPDDDISWAVELEEAGVIVDSVMKEYEGEALFQGLGFYPKINEIFISQIKENLERISQ